MLNNISVMGRLTADPEVRTTQSGVSVCSFCIANDKDFKKEGEAPNWIDCVAWRSTAEFIGKYFSKGSAIIVTGQLQTRQYEDRDGHKRKAVEVVVNQVHFAESKKESAEATVTTYEPPQSAAPEEPRYAQTTVDDFTVTADDDDDLPF